MASDVSWPLLRRHRLLLTAGIEDTMMVDAQRLAAEERALLERRNAADRDVYEAALAIAEVDRRFLDSWDEQGESAAK